MPDRARIAGHIWPGSCPAGRQWAGDGRCHTFPRIGARNAVVVACVAAKDALARIANSGGCCRLTWWKGIRLLSAVCLFCPLASLGVAGWGMASALARVLVWPVSGARAECCRLLRAVGVSYGVPSVAPLPSPDGMASDRDGHRASFLAFFGLPGKILTFPETQYWRGFRRFFSFRFTQLLLGNYCWPSIALHITPTHTS